MSATKSGSVPTFGRRNIKDLPSSTSDFTEKDLIFLNIRYENPPNSANIFDNFPTVEDVSKYNYLRLQDSNYESLADLAALKRYANDMERKMASIANYLISVLEVTEETVTNDLVSFLLSELELNLSPFRLRHERKYVIRMLNKEIVSVPDLSIEDKSTILLVDEDKSMFNVDHTSAWGENQMGGEIFTALYRNYSNNPLCYGEDHPVYAIRVIGSFFTFYRATVDEKYLKAVSQENVVEEYDELGRRTVRLSQEIVINRYPPNDVRRIDRLIPSMKRGYVGLNYLEPNERRKIVDLLLSLKASLENMELVT